MLGDYTRDAVTAVKYGGAKESPLIDTWFTKASTGSGSDSKAGTFKDTDLQLTTIGDAYQEINDYMIDAVGRNATQAEKDAYYKNINTLEKKSAVKTVATRDSTGKITTTTRSGGFVTEDERLNARNSIVIKALEGTDAGELLKSSKGSQVAIQIAALQKASAEYGQPISAGEALKYVISGGTEKDALAKQTERIRLNSMTIYGNLKDHIRDGGNVKDIADQYALIKARKLGIPVTDAFNDKDVQAALTRDGGLMSTAEFSRQMQANPLWRQTEEARNTASTFADTILKSFGFMG
jgi:ribosomal protein L12E/L44/L45/RPP1/RPP2